MSAPFETMEQWYNHLEGRIQEDQTAMDYWESKFNSCKEKLTNESLEKAANSCHFCGKLQ